MSTTIPALLAPEDPPGFILRTDLGKAADDNGFRLSGGNSGGWLRRTSTTAPATIWLAGAGAAGPWLLALDRADIAAEIAAPTAIIQHAPAASCFALSSLPALYA